MSVFVLDKRKRPLMPCSERRARMLLERGRAAVHRRTPFTLRLRDRSGGDLQPIRLSLDPGSKTTGVALAREREAGRHALVLGEIEHRGEAVHRNMRRRAAYRRRRRSKNLRYRAPRFDNRRRRPGWLPPSLRSRVGNVETWVGRLRAKCPITSISVEVARFDTQVLQDPTVSGQDYQRGTLYGCEAREYVLAHWGRRCVYCRREGVRLTLDHVVARSRGGSTRPSNLVPACIACNQEKSNQPVERFLAAEPERLSRILAHLKAPLRDAAAVNSMRAALSRRLRATGLPVEEATGGRTRWNRERFCVPKTHALDALLAGEVEAVAGWQRPVLVIRSCGRGSYQRTRVTTFGFPRGYLIRHKSVFGFASGDLVRAQVPTGAKAGVWVGRVAVRASGSFNIQAPGRLAPVQGVSHRFCRRLARADGYSYHIRFNTEAVLPPRPEVRGLRAGD